MEPSTSHSVQSSGSGALAPLMSPYMSSPQSMDQPPSPASSLPDCADATPCLGQGVFSLQPFSLSDAPSTPKPKRVPRPANAFMLFRSDFLRSGTVPSEVERKQQTLSKLAGKIWESMDEDEKSKWRNKAEKVKDEHRRAHPDYKFTPMRGPARLKARGQTDERGQDRNGESWIEELRLRYAPTTPPGRPLKGRGHRKHQPTISPKLEYPPEQLSPMAISPTPSPSLSSNASYFPPPVGMLPRRPSSAPGLRPSSIPMECDYKPPVCTGLETRPILPFQLHPQDHRFLPRRPSTATGGRTSQEAMVTDYGQSSGYQYANMNENHGAYPLPSPIHFHDPFTAQPVNTLGQNMASLHIGDTLPPFTHESVSPLDARHISQYHLSNGLHFPNTTFPNATSPNATSPLTPGMQVDFASKQDEGVFQYANTQKPRFEAGAFAGIVYSQDGYAHHAALLPPYVPGAYSHYGNVNSESDYSMHYGSPQ